MKEPICSNSSDAARALEAEYLPGTLPACLARDYRIVSCLKYTDRKQAYLLEDSGGQKYIGKRRPNQPGEDAASLRREWVNLETLSFSFIPKPVQWEETPDDCWLIREYIPGETLEQLVERQGPLAPRRAACLVKELCGLLELLHRQDPPVLHRDIKPQNILRKPEGSWYFIDLETARTFKEGQAFDTLFLGTRGAAAPEQFGYEQTSVRSDVYGMGVLLSYLCTGGYSTSVSVLKELPLPLRKIILKCTAFDPKRRYASAASLRRELTCFGRIGQRIRPALIAILLCLCLAGGLGFYGHRLALSQRAVLLESPAVQNAALSAVGKSAEDLLLPEDLEQVTSLILCGDRVFTDWNEHLNYHSDFWFEVAEQPLAFETFPLNDLNKFPNLTSLSLDNQGISDLSPLKGLSLERLSLCRNAVTDLTPLSECKKLRILWLTENPVEDLMPLSGLASLTELDLQNTLVQSLEPLYGHPLTFLDCTGAPIQTSSLLDQFPLLDTLRISGADRQTIAAVNRLSGLKILGLFDSSLESLEELNGLSSLECIDVTGSHSFSALEGLERFPSLTYLGLASTAVTDLSPTASAPFLEMIDVSNLPAEDYSPLLSCPRLRTVYVNEGKAGLLRQQLKETSAEIIPF